MLTGHKYDTCVVTESIRAAGLDHDRQAMAALRLHHCERYAAMPPGFHADLASQTLALFAGRPVPPHRGGVDGDALPQRPGGHRRAPLDRYRSRRGDAPAIQHLVSLPSRRERSRPQT